MKKIISLLIAFAALFNVVFASISAFGADAIPVLKSISFTNSEIEGSFSPDIFEYTITLTDNSITPSLESYDVEGDGELFVTYEYDQTGMQTAIVATLNYENGSMIYTFTYSNPAVTPSSSNNLLTDIYCTYGEISPAVNKEDTKYTLYIPSDLTELSITPVTADTNASCPPLQLSLNEEQTPAIMLKCTASDGNEREYTLEIKRVDKTTEQVKSEMSQQNYETFVEETKVYENPEFLLIMICAAAGLLVIIILRRIAVRLTANPYDKNEKPFYME